MDDRTRVLTRRDLRQTAERIERAIATEPLMRLRRELAEARQYVEDELAKLTGASDG